jgi:hypothetical protein
VSDGSDSGSVGQPCGVEYGNAVDVPDVALSAARCVHPGFGESCCQIRHSKLQITREHCEVQITFSSQCQLFLFQAICCCVLFLSECLCALILCHTSHLSHVAPPADRATAAQAAKAPTLAQAPRVIARRSHGGRGDLVPSTPASTAQEGAEAWLPCLYLLLWTLCRHPACFPPHLCTLHANTRWIAGVTHRLHLKIIGPPFLLDFFSDAGRSCAANARVARDRGCLHLER